MDIRKVGALRTLGLWEDLLGSLPEHAEGPEGLGRIWEHENPARVVGQDPVMRQGWRLAVVRGVSFEIPIGADETVYVSAEQSATGKPYALVWIDQTAVHVHGGLTFVEGVVEGDVHVCAKVLWPKGADERDGDGTKAWRNYLLYVDIYPTAETEISQVLEVYPEGSDRAQLIMLGTSDTLDPQPELPGKPDDPTPVTVWASRSANWKPARGGNRSTGSDQLVFFAPKKT